MEILVGDSNWTLCSEVILLGILDDGRACSFEVSHISSCDGQSKELNTSSYLILLVSAETSPLVLSFAVSI